MECFNPLMNRLLKASQIACHLDFPVTSILYYDNDSHTLAPCSRAPTSNQNLTGTTNGLSNRSWELEFSGNDCG